MGNHKVKSTVKETPLYIVEAEKKRREFEKIIADISRVFINVLSEKDFDNAINHALQHIRIFFDADRCYIFEFSDDLKTMSYTYEDCAKDVSPQVGKFIDFPVNLTPWWFDKIRQNNYIHIPDVKNMPKEADAERKELESQDIKSLIVFSIKKQENLIGFFGIDMVKNKRTWHYEEIILLQILADIFAGAYTRRKIEKKTKSAYAFLDNMVNSIPDPIFVKNEQHQFILVNDALCKFLKISRDKLLGKSDYDFFPKEQAEIFWQKDNVVFTTGEMSVNEENIVDSTGKTLIISTKKTLFILPDTKEKVLVGIIRDITERVQYEHFQQIQSRLEKETIEKEQQQNFVSMVSHEFKTPLSIIDSSAQRILRKITTMDTSEIASRMERIRNNVSRLNSLVESTLSLSKLDAGKLSINPSKNDLKDIALSVISEIRNIAPDRTINFQHSGNTEGMFDYNRIYLVTTNLVSNAIKYSAEEINIKCDEYSNYIRIAVEDKGCGLSPEDLEQIGNKFFRARHTESIPGTGVGIYLVKNIIDMHGGKLEIKSERSIGSTFIVSLLKNLDDYGI